MPPGRSDPSAGPRAATAPHPPGSAPVVVLASASPARARLLRDAGLDPEVRVSSVDEAAVVAGLPPSIRDDPARHCLVLAAAKARDVAASWSGLGSPPDALIVGCDSVLDVAGVPHGKPASAADAVLRWQRDLRGRSAVLRTGHWVIRTATGEEAGDVAATRVDFARPSDEEIAAYVATGEPLAVAGAFTLDGLGAAFVERIDGDPSTVVGLSLPLLRLLAGRLGVPWPSLWRPAPAGPDGPACAAPPAQRQPADGR